MSSVAPPFRAAFWSDIRAIGRDLGLEECPAAAWEQPEIQEKFLTALARQVPGVQAFRPGTIGFLSPPAEMRRREQFRERRAALTFLGLPSRDVVLGALECAANRLKGRAFVEVQFKQWDTLSDWAVVQERIGEVLSYLLQTKQFDGGVTVFTHLAESKDHLWEFLYDRPRVRVGWLAADLATGSRREEFEHWRRNAPVFENLRSLSDSGAWPYILLPASEANARLLPELVLALIEVTRGGTVEIAPAAMVMSQADRSLRIPPSPDPSSLLRERAPEGQATAYGSRSQDATHDSSQLPDVDEFVAAMLAIYRNSRIPLRLVSPLSWVKARIDADTALIGSPLAAGAEIAVLANGDIYAGEGCVGLDPWRLGNVLDGADPLAWERLDAMPEVFSRSTAPDRCKTCDWRYRCGGIDPAVRLLEQQRHLDARSGWSPLCELYCAPRKALFEEMLWDSVEAAAAGTEKRPRERIELHPDGFTFEPIAATEEA